MRKRTPVEGSASQVSTAKQGESNLEIKQRKLQEQKVNPEFSELPETYNKRSKFAEKPIDDEKETGILAEEEGEEKEDAMATGILPEEEEDDYEVPELEQKDLRPKPDPKTKKSQNPRAASGLEARNRRNNRDNPETREERPRRTQNENQERPDEPQRRRQNNSNDGGNQNRNRGRGNSQNDNPPVRPEDKIAQERARQRHNNGNNRGGGKGAGLVVVLIIAILLILTVIGFLVIKKVRPDLISGLFDKGSNTPSESVQQVKSTEDFSNSLYYSGAANAILNLYTDQDKHDIREDVTSDEVTSCLELLSVYQSSEEYNETAYNELFNELQTISLFLQDRETYNKLMNSSEELTPEEYASKLQGIRNDISMYRVQSLVSAMNAKLSILETMETVEGSANPPELDDLGITDTSTSIQDDDFGLEGQGENSNTSDSQGTDSSSMMQTWGNGGGLVVENETE